MRDFDLRTLKRPALMGVVNVTPDSFSDGGIFADAGEAVAHGLRLVEDGADILDIGGESTRPGAAAVSVEEEHARVLPVIERLAQETDALISVDTRKPETARAAVAAGAGVWNDVSALTYAPDSIETAAALGCGVVLMHAQGDPETMQRDPRYENVVEDVLTFLKDRIEACIAAGIARDKLIIDPGVGFGKTLEHNLALVAALDRFAAIGPPVLLGASRKSFIAALDRDGPAKGRLGGSLAAALSGWRRGAAIFRVHDVAETRQALAVFDAIEKTRSLR